MTYETTVTGATRLGSGIGALLRCGAVEWPAGANQRGFLTQQYALVWTVSGTGTYRDATGRSWRLGPGDAFQRFPGASHDVLTVGATRWWYVAVPSTLLQTLRDIGLPTLAQPVFTVGLDARLPSRFTAIVRHLRTSPDRDLPACLVSMLELIVELHRRGARSRAEDPHRVAIEAACARIAEEPERHWSPRALAQDSGMGYHAFRKAFARHMGCGAAGWAVRRRLVAAQALLADSKLSVADVAQRVGYEDPLQFSAIFRRHHGVSPRRWRRGS